VNNKDEIRMVMRNKSLFDWRSQRNVIKFNPANGLIHELVKAAICYKLLEAGHDFLTEAEFKGGRADVVDLTTGVIYEIMESETNTSIEAKRAVYPLPIVPVETTRFLSDKGDLEIESMEAYIP